MCRPLKSGKQLSKQLPIFLPHCCAICNAAALQHGHCHTHKLRACLLRARRQVLPCALQDGVQAALACCLTSIPCLHQLEQQSWVLCSLQC